MGFNFFRENSELVTVSFDLRMSGLHDSKNAITRLFPDTEFIVERANFCCKKCSRGVIRVNDNSFDLVKNQISKIDNFELEILSESKKLFQYRFNESLMSKIPSTIPFFVVFPIRFRGKGLVSYKILILDKYVNKFFNELEKNNIEFRIFSKGKADHPTCKILTDRQREIFSLVHKEGFYQFPRRISIQGLSKKFGLTPSNLSKHLMKIESKVMNAFAEGTKLKHA